MDRRSDVQTVRETASTGEAIFPQAFSAAHPAAAAAVYLHDPSVRKLLQFFEKKGLTALKDEDRREQWYDDWLDYQARHHLYAGLLAPKQYSTLGSELNLFRLARFIEVFGYCSPAHGYSLHVSFLGLFSILMGTNAALKREAIASLENGGLFAFGVSEQAHGSDLLANEFTLRGSDPGKFIANGRKYYIGNANCASIVSILARNENARGNGNGNGNGNAHRAPLALFALRPASSPAFGKVRKIPTLGIRAAFVGEFEVANHALPETDLIAVGRAAWDAVLGTVTLGKFLLGFGAIGICQHAWQEAVDHLSRRNLFGSPAIRMPHLRQAMSEAYARLTAMKLYAYRAMDYVQTASSTERRYVLFAAVQKARVSTEGVKVMTLLSQSIGARGFESDTFFEMALRDAQLIPSLEGSAHINLAMTAEFLPNYFSHFDRRAAVPGSAFAGARSAAENSYLMEAGTRGQNTIRFSGFLAAYKPFAAIPTVRMFAAQAAAFARFIRRGQTRDLLTNTENALALGACLAIIAYAQLVAENCTALMIPTPIVSAIFHLFIQDLTLAGTAVATLPSLSEADRVAVRRLIIVPPKRGDEWEFVGQRVKGTDVCM